MKVFLFQRDQNLLIQKTKEMIPNKKLQTFKDQTIRWSNDKIYSKKWNMSAAEKILMNIRNEKMEETTINHLYIYINMDHIFKKISVLYVWYICRYTK